MSDKKLSFLGFAAVVSVVLAVAVSQFANKSKLTPAGTGYLLQGLDPATITQIIVKQGGNTVTLNRKDNGFVVAEKSDYPAATKIINNLITSCLDIKTVEPYTEDKANYKDLGITEENMQGMITFYGSDGKIITGFIIGKETESGKGNYFYGKRVNDNQVYVLRDVPWIQANAIEYVISELINLKKDSIDWVTVTSVKDSYSFVSEANGTEIKLQELPAGKKQKESECKQVFNAMTSLRFEDVMTESQANDLVFDRKFNCQLKDSTLFSIKIAKKDADTYIKCSAEFTDKTQVRKEEGVESPEELQKKEAKLLAREKSQKLQETTSGWVYKIPSYLADNMTKPMTELVEDANDVNATAGKVIQK